MLETSDAHLGRLSFRPDPDRATSAPPGAGALASLAVHVPAGLDARPARLVVVLHGAGGRAEQALDLLRAVADERRLLLVAPQSVAATWDVIAGGYGPDARALDALLAEVSSTYPVGAVSVAGFSDGASYALSLGLANGDVFDSVIAFSPGFEAAAVTHGRPRVFVSHGTDDHVLPINPCSRRLVPLLEKRGYDVHYLEFRGGHTVPTDVAWAAGEWLDTPQ